MAERLRSHRLIRGSTQKRENTNRRDAEGAPQRFYGGARHILGLVLVLSLFGATPAPSMAQEIRVLDLLANDLVYEPVSERIYASVPSAAGPGLGNTLTVINPFSGRIESSVFVGSEPGQLEVSDDGQFVYVGFEGASAVRRYDIATATLEPPFFLGADPLRGVHLAEDIDVLPGAANSFAVSRKVEAHTSGHSDVAVYDDDVMRPKTTDGEGISNRIEFSESASLLFGVNNENTEFGFRQISVTADGATETAVQWNMISDFFVDIEFEQGVVYTTGSFFSGGRAIDPKAMLINGVYASHGPVEADATHGRVYFLEGNEFTGTTLLIFDLATFIPLDFIPIPEISGNAGSLIRWGPDDGLAFRTSGGQVFLLSQLTLGPQNPSCTVELDDVSYRDGDPVVATSLRVTNPSVRTISVEGRLWFDQPDGTPIARNGILPSGSVDLPPGTDIDLGPVTLGTVTAGLPRGLYAFNCRLIDANTADHMALGTDTFRLD